MTAGIAGKGHIENDTQKMRAGIRAFGRAVLSPLADVERTVELRRTCSSTSSARMPCRKGGGSDAARAARKGRINGMPSRRAGGGQSPAHSRCGSAPTNRARSRTVRWMAAMHQEGGVRYGHPDVPAAALISMRTQFVRAIGRFAAGVTVVTTRQLASGCGGSRRAVSLLSRSRRRSCSSVCSRILVLVRPLIEETGAFARSTSSRRDNEVTCRIASPTARRSSPRPSAASRTGPK